MLEYHPNKDASLEDIVHKLAPLGFREWAHRPDAEPGLGLLWLARG